MQNSSQPNFTLTLPADSPFPDSLQNLYTDVKLHPDDSYAYFRLASALHLTCYSELATQVLIKAISLNNQDADMFNLLGESLFEQCRLDEAIKAYKRAISINPKHGMALANLARIYDLQLKIDESMRLSNQAIEFDASFGYGYVCLSSAYESNGDVSEAKLVLSKAASALPDYKSLFKRLISQSDVSTQLLLIEGLSSDLLFLFYKLGVILRISSVMSDYVEICNLAIKMNPRNSHAHLSLGYFYYSQRQYQKAIENYSNAMKINPNDCCTLYNIGTSLLRQDQLKEAAQVYRDTVSTYRRQLQLSVISVLQDPSSEDKKSSTSTEKAAEHAYPTYIINSYHNLGIIQKRQNQDKDTIESFKMVTKLKSNEALAFKNIGQIYQKKLNLNEGLKYLRKANLIKKMYREFESLTVEMLKRIGSELNNRNISQILLESTGINLPGVN